MDSKILRDNRRFAGAFLINERGDVLLQLRDSDPSIDNPGKISVFGGSLEANENYRDGLIRELKEELNALFCDSELKFLSKIRKTESGITTDCEFYYIKLVDDLKSYTVSEGTGLILELSRAHLDDRLTPTCLAMVKELQSKTNYGYALATGEGDIERLDALDSVYGVDARRFVEYACKDIHPTTIIDYGCGHGHMTAFLAGLYPCAQVFGIDTSMEQLESARARYRSIIGRLQFIHTSELFEFDIKADIIFSKFVIIHQVNVDAYNDEILSLCHNNTIVIFIEPILNGMLVIPHIDAIYRANELTIQLGLSKGINYSISKREIESITSRFDIKEFKVMQPILGSSNGKFIVARSFDQISGELIDRCICTTDETEKISRELWEFVADTTISCAGMQIIHLACSPKERLKYSK